ncbi:MAG TPA: hypothetical protein VHM92_03465 [Allosphingosinicella sp.]|nr:hypothetical protein [Allosphingosinicella sp.]
MKMLGKHPLSKKCVAALLLAAVTLAAPADARSRRAAASSAVDIATVHVFADCVTGKYPAAVRKLLALDYRKKEYSNALHRLLDASNSCTPFAWGRLRSSNLLLVGAFAEQMLPKTLAGVPLADRIAYDPSKPPVAARDDGEYLGLCLARTMPAETAALLATRPVSWDEGSAADALTPGMGPCLRSGARARVNMAGLRALLALAAYRLVSQAGS